MLSQVDGVWWLLFWLAPLLLLQRRVHFEIQALLFLLFRRMDIVLVLFSLIFLPGVLIHELSHFIVARLLGVRTGKFSILPQRLEDGRLQLGYVETAASDFVRDALIGAAPLIAGGIAVTYIGRAHLGFDRLAAALSNGDPATWLEALAQVLQLPDFWLWFYLLFTISSTMLPSVSDRKAWLPFTVVAAVVVLAGLILGVGPWIFTSLAPAVNKLFRALAVVFSFSVVAHLALFAPVGVLRYSLSRITRLQVH